MSIVWGGPFEDWENACITDEVTAKSAKSWKWRFWECANAAGSCCASASRKTFVWWWFLWLGMLLVASETSKMWKPELKCGNSGSLAKKTWDCVIVVRLRCMNVVMYFVGWNIIHTLFCTRVCCLSPQSWEETLRFLEHGWCLLELLDSFHR